jgi:hypothetical protein
MRPDKALANRLLEKMQAVTHQIVVADRVGNRFSRLHSELLAADFEPPIHQGRQKWQ